MMQILDTTNKQTHVRWQWCDDFKFLNWCIRNRALVNWISSSMLLNTAVYPLFLFTKWKTNPSFMLTSINTYFGLSLGFS